MGIISTLLCICVQSTTYALVQGELHTTAQIQEYSGTISTGLHESVPVFAPMQDSNGNLRTIAIERPADQDEAYLLTISPKGELIKKTHLPSTPVMYTVTIDQEDNIYVVLEGENNTAHLYRYDVNHNQTLDIPGDGYISVAVDTTGTIYASAVINNGEFVIKTFNRQGALTHTSSPLQENGQPLAAISLAADRHDKLYAALASEGDLAILAEINNNGSILRKLDDNKPFHLGYGISTDRDDNLYAASLQQNGPDECMGYDTSIRKYNSAGQYVGNLDTSPANSGGFVCSLYGVGSTPSAMNVSVGASGDIFLASIETDTSNNTAHKSRIVKYSYPKTMATFKQNSHTTKTRLNTSNSAQITAASTSTPSEIGAPADSTREYPLGLVRFVAKTDSTALVDITLLFETALTPGDVSARKYNSITKQYSDVPEAIITQAQLDGKPALQVSYQVADGGALDEDGVVNGEIIDPIGLAVNTSNQAAPVLLAPNTGYEYISRNPTVAIAITSSILVSVALLITSYKRTRRA